MFIVLEMSNGYLGARPRSKFLNFGDLRSGAFEPGTSIANLGTTFFMNVSR